MKNNQIDRLKLMLVDPSYETPYEAISEILEIDNIDDVFFKFILGLEDKLVLIDFLKNYVNFSDSQLDIIEEFVNDNLSHGDKLFVSELIEIANELNIVSIYDRCIEFINDENEDNIVVMESIFMVYEHIDFEQIESVYEALEKVINSNKYYQNCQLASAFYLLRLSGYEKYYNDVVDYVENGQSMNRELLTNLLKKEYNQEKYFSYYNQLLAFI